MGEFNLAFILVGTFACFIWPKYKGGHIFGVIFGILHGSLVRQITICDLPFHTCYIRTDIPLYFGNMFVVQMLKLYWKDK